MVIFSFIRFFEFRRFKFRKFFSRRQKPGQRTEKFSAIFRNERRAKLAERSGAAKKIVAVKKKTTRPAGRRNRVVFVIDISLRQ
jgi:hypothetical protein